MADSFSFDYEAEAEKAYGELGTYYTRILNEARGDVDKVLARLVEDYDRGIRLKKEDTELAKSNIDSAQKESERLLAIARKETKQNVVNDAQSRGLLSKSNFDTNKDQANMEGYGIPTETFKTGENKLLGAFAYDTEGRNKQKTALDTSLNRYIEEEDINKTRTTEDQKTALERKEYELEQARREEAATMANNRASQAYANYQYSNLI